MTQSRKVFASGKGAINLKPTEHVATGGEGALYIKQDIAYKIYLEPAKARAAGMANKIELLSKIQSPYIVAPLGVLLDEQHNLVGHYMPAVRGEPLVKTFSNTWRAETGFSTANALELVSNMQQAIAAAHAANALIVDGNEMNYMVQAKDAIPKLIDVDSWQIGPFKATAQMPSIRDYHSPAFTTMSDWFAWAIVTFQVLTGIHPYKGVHPAFKRGDIESRMRANASVFGSAVKLNSAVRDFNEIPGGLRSWYERVFEKGERTTPPLQYGNIVAPGATPSLRVRTLPGGGILKHESLWRCPSRIRHIAPNGIVFYGQSQVSGAYDLQQLQEIETAGLNLEKALTGQAVLVRALGAFVWLELTPGGISAKMVAGSRSPRSSARRDFAVLQSRATSLRLFENLPFALDPQTENGLLELAIDEFGSTPVVSVRMGWPLLVESSQFLRNLILTDYLGTPFVTVPGPKGVQPLKATALRDYLIVDGIAHDNALIALLGLSKSDGKAYRLWLRKQGEALVLDSAVETDSTELIAAYTGRGVVAILTEDGALQLASSASLSCKDVADSSLTRSMSLFSLGDGLAYAKDNVISTLKMV